MHRLKKTGRVAFFFLFFFLANAFTSSRKCNLQCHPVVRRRKDAERRGLSVAHVIWLLRAAGRVGQGWWGVVEVRLTGPHASSGCRNGKMTLVMNKPCLPGGSGESPWT